MKRIRLRYHRIMQLLMVIALIIFCPDLFARPDFDVHPRTIERRLGGIIPIRDNMDIDNFGGNEVLVWSLEIIPEGGEWPDGIEWLTINVQDGEIDPNEGQRIVVRQNDDDLEDGHYFADILFTTNDPTREEFIVPVAGHNADYPQISTDWPEGWGGWWGVDMNNIFDNITWGDTPSIQLRIRNRGSAELVIDEIASSNGFWELDTSTFDLEPDGSLLVRFTFSAEEVGPNSTTITSESNVWDPRELNFRIIAAVDPAFRMGIGIPDTVIDEDSESLVIADLDSVFIISDRGIEYEVIANNLSWEISRSHELTVTPDQNWNGISEVIISVAREDAVLADTFLVTVNAMPDAPLSFDLLAPSDGDTIRWDAIEDSMFVWQSSIDVDGDTIRYSVLFIVDDTTVVVGESTDTTALFSILDHILNLENGGRFSWTVHASDDTLITEAWSTFTNYAVPTSENSNAILLPVTATLVEIFPNPFNNSTMININLPRYGQLKLEIFDPMGRLVKLLDNSTLPPGQFTYNWLPDQLVSGSYILKLEFDGNVNVYQLGLIK